jgi:hypothetical protein
MKRLMKMLSQLVWQQGVCNDRVARRNRLTGSVQGFVVWEGDSEGEWIRFHESHWNGFKVKKGDAK